MARGVCLKIGGKESKTTVVLRYDDGVDIEISETAYRLNGYSPSISDLKPCPTVERKSSK